MKKYGRRRGASFRRGPPARIDGAAALFTHARKLYPENGDAGPMAEALLDAAFTAIAGTADDVQRRALLRRTFERAYEALGEP